jgi:hypothetical protein
MSMKSVPLDRGQSGIGNDEAASRPTSFLCLFFVLWLRETTVIAGAVEM